MGDITLEMVGEISQLKGAIAEVKASLEEMPKGVARTANATEGLERGMSSVSRVANHLLGIMGIGGIYGAIRTIVHEAVKFEDAMGKAAGQAAKIRSAGARVGMATRLPAMEGAAAVRQIGLEGAALGIGVEQTQDIAAQVLEKTRRRGPEAQREAVQAALMYAATGRPTAEAVKLGGRRGGMARAEREYGRFMGFVSEDPVLAAEQRTRQMRARLEYERAYPVTPEAQRALVEGETLQQEKIATAGAYGRVGLGAQVTEENQGLWTRFWAQSMGQPLLAPAGQESYYGGAGNVGEAGDDFRQAVNGLHQVTRDMMTQSEQSVR